jgi:hypothetical protein
VRIAVRHHAGNPRSPVLNSDKFGEVLQPLLPVAHSPICPDNPNDPNLTLVGATLDGRSNVALGYIGELPRDWFASTGFLDRVASGLAAQLADIRARPVHPHC